MKGLPAELYQMLYEQPIYPKNLYLDREPIKHAEYREKVIQKQIDLMHQRGSGSAPTDRHRRLLPYILKTTPPRGYLSPP